MKIRKTEPIIELTEPIDETANPMLSVYTDGDPEQNPRSFAIVIDRVPRAEVFRKRPDEQKLQGRPVVYSILYSTMSGPAKLALWPIPDRDYHARFEFNPPRRSL